ncbi:MAG TPA: hypothetical protein V6C81_22380 [Planktothrix sp.]
MSSFASQATATIIAAASAASLTLPCFATTTYTGSVNHTKHTTTTVRSSTQKTYWQQHPKVKSAVVGAGVGTAAGALTGLVTHKGIVRGGMIGAGTGAGVGLIRSSDTMRRHPIVKNAATGTAVGMGLGLAGGRGSHPAVKAGAVGGAVGLGYGLFKDLH